MKRREKQLIILALLMLVPFMMVLVIPGLVDIYRQGQQDIAQMQDRILRLQNLAAATSQWQEREALKAAEIAELESWIFGGNDPNLVGNNVQRSLRQVLEKSGISIREMSVARYSYVDSRLQVTQEISFSLDQKNILPFLNSLQELRPRLFVQAFSVARNRRQYTGNITVVGFGEVKL